MAEAIRREVEREVSALLRLVLEDRRKTGGFDLEAVEMAMRAAMHRAGASALSQLLRGDPPGTGDREVPCPCGRSPGRYRQMRARRVMTAMGEVELLRAPGICVRTAITGSVRPMALWILRKRICTAEAIEADIAAGAQREIQRAPQLSLPIVAGPSIPILYVEMDGTGVPVVKAETQGRAGKVKGQPAHTREAKIAASLPRPRGIRRVTPCAIRTRRPRSRHRNGGPVRSSIWSLEPRLGAS